MFTRLNVFKPAQSSIRLVGLSVAPAANSSHWFTHHTARTKWSFRSFAAPSAKPVCTGSDGYVSWHSRHISTHICDARRIACFTQRPIVLMLMPVRFSRRRRLSPKAVLARSLHEPW